MVTKQLIEVLWVIANELGAMVKAVEKNTEVQREIADSSLRAAENFFRLGMGKADDED